MLLIVTPFGRGLTILMALRYREYPAQNNHPREDKVWRHTPNLPVFMIVKVICDTKDQVRMHQ